MSSIDKLFDNLGYGENWASWWLDFARYADTNGFEATEQGVSGGTGIGLLML